VLSLAFVSALLAVLIDRGLSLRTFNLTMKNRLLFRTENAHDGKLAL
jgi:hypothetical protein